MDISDQLMSAGGRQCEGAVLQVSCVWGACNSCGVLVIALLLSRGLSASLRLLTPPRPAPAPAPAPCLLSHQAPTLWTAWRSL